MSFMRHYFNIIHRGRYVWILFWLIVLIISAIFGLKFLDSTRDAFDAPKGTAAYDAHQTFRKDFPMKSDINNMVILVSSLRNESITHTNVVTSYGTSPLAYQHYTHVCNTLSNYHVKGLIQQCIGYFTYNSSTTLSKVGDQFVNDAGTMTMILVNYKFWDRQIVNDLIKDVRHLSDQVGNPDTQRWKVGITGSDVLFLDTTEETANDMVRMDSIVLPVAFFVLACYLKSFRLLIIPLLSVAISILSSFTIMLPIAEHVMDVAAFSPSVMMSLVIAMSIDYSLFLLTRYREEILAGHTDVDSVFNMLRHAGHVVFVSGSTLALSFTGLTFFPFDFLRSVGIGCCMALTNTMFVNLTLTPALLLTAPNFFHNFSLPRCLHKVLPASFLDDVPKNRNIDETDSDGLGSVLLDHAAVDHESESAHDRARQRQLNSFWYKSAKLSTTTLYSVILLALVIAVSLPSALQVLKMKHTMDNTQLFPRDAGSLITFKELTAPGAFSPGLLGPFQIIVTTNATKSILTEGYFNATHDVIRTLLSTFPSTDLSAPEIRAISFVPDFPGLDNPYISVQLARYFRDIEPYKYLFDNQTNIDESASIITIQTRFDPLSQQAEPFVTKTRQILDTFNQHAKEIGSGYEFYLTGSTTDEIDNVNAIFGLFPIMVFATTGAVFFVVMIIFRSLLVPIRAIMTIGLAIAVTYGFATLVFQQHKFDWTSDHLKDVDSLFWLTPIMSFSILVGLGLDYDIFLFSRIVEYRRSGFTNRAAILKGVYKTGGIITGAGLIMAISFGGLMLSSEMVLNQFGFLLCLAVLFDTFVIRTLVVPAIIHLAGQANWWPGKMPPAFRDELDTNDLDDEPGVDIINGDNIGFDADRHAQADSGAYTFANSRNTSPRSY